MPDWIIAVILGIVEGITEFLPVSSTGHLLIAEHWLPRQTDLFNVVIQCGAVIAVIPLFHKRFHQFIFNWREKATQDYMLKICVAFVITGAIGFVLDKKGLKLPEELKPVAIALLAGGLAFLLVEYWLRGKKLQDEVTWPVVIAVGLGQIVAAVFPGASRSGTTIILSLMLGLNRPLATEFSFLVGIPTMLAAGGLKIFQAFHHRHALGAPTENWNMLIICTIVSAIVSFIAVKWLLRYVQNHTFNLFGWYRIALAIGIFVLLSRH
ncbi:MAG TPA: undecaprenyl-diphosphate phosphatase [Verrucomicrobiae bacterium]|nr:undecaprenyl-diphosphate phosphatase [Verrucomicrobiae bacterium]